ncbi:MAG: DUF2817 domain-containing protein [Rubripirellula sp.]|nr:DUF2817 domain-containing protein [Rubripirellula sp.]
MRDFSADYFEARERFCESANAVGAELVRYPITVDQSLSIDVAIVNARASRQRLVVSSGVHGVEGPLGSAIQLSMLRMLHQSELPDDLGYTLIHSINPFGYAHHRRWNEENVDLNRNFKCSSNTYSGCPAGYKNFESVLNPKTAPSRLEPFRVKAFWNIALHGVQAIKEAVATGQYEYPQGLFYGGRAECFSSRIVRENFHTWMGESDEIVHLDVHTGLGRFADYRLLLEYPPGAPAVAWFRELFGRPIVEDGGSHPTSYDARGTFGLWAMADQASLDYRFATVEVGTHPIVRVLAALRAENRAHHYASSSSDIEWARQELRECFCPTSPKWRRKVLADQMKVVQRCAQQLKKAVGNRSEVVGSC